MLDPKVSALLRLKRHEQPPPGYFDRLLADVHRRQREELLQRPLWKIAAERMQVLFSEHSMGNLSYAGAMAAVLVVGVTAIGLMTPGASQPAARNFAENTPPQPPAAAAPVSPGPNRMLVLGPDNGAQLAPLIETRQVSSPQIGAPRYIIDARPVSYERASSF
jgi:hypothetical protein